MTRRSAKAFPPPLARHPGELRRGSPKRLRREGGALRIRWVIALTIAVCAVVPFTAQTPSKPPAACDALGALKLPDVTITAATPVEAGAFRAPGANATAPAMNTPAFCRVAATLAPTPESHIKIEVWLPPAAVWNGKFLGTGNGGAAGIISYPALAATADGLVGAWTANTPAGSEIHVRRLTAPSRR